MKKLFPISLLLALALVTGCPDDQTGRRPAAEAKLQEAAQDEAGPEVLARVHFAGTGALLSAPGAETLNRIAEMEQTTAFVEEVLEKLGRVLAGMASAGNQLPQEKNQSLIRPLLGDLPGRASYFEMRAGDSREWALAIRTGDRSETWSRNLHQLVHGGSGTEPEEAWSAPIGSEGRRFHFQTGKEWIVMGEGGAENLLAGEFATRLQAGSAPFSTGESLWLDAAIDFPRLAEVHGTKLQTGLPYVLLSAETREDTVRLKGELRSPEPLELKLGAWQMPTNTIHDPLVSFTALRGMGGWFDKLGEWKAFLPSPLPNQLFVWAQEQLPYLLHAAVPAPGAKKQLAERGPKLVREVETRLERPDLGQLIMLTNNTALQWQRMFPIVIPFVTTGEAGDEDFLHGGLFPLRAGAHTNPPPAALLQQIEGRDNLVLYHWEVTQPHLLQWQKLFQVLSIVSAEPRLNIGTAGQKWIQAVAPHLGNSVTEVVRSSPTTFEFQRKSHLGLTALELMMLVHWQESAGFPGAGLRPPFLPLRQLHVPGGLPPARNDPGRKRP